MVTIELGNFAGGVIPDLLQCEGEKAHKIETMICSYIVKHTMFGDARQCGRVLIIQSS